IIVMSIKSRMMDITLGATLVAVYDGRREVLTPDCRSGRFQMQVARRSGSRPSCKREQPGPIDSEVVQCEPNARCARLSRLNLQLAPSDNGNTWVGGARYSHASGIGQGYERDVRGSAAPGGGCFALDGDDTVEKALIEWTPTQRHRCAKVVSARSTT
ncbi:hypothetical protein, partial [Burkholderia pyrrocinia]|uniref:hypothetical protein n=1 Tax=Burkholderia pyrrocinia TaxID=60550 RepID=UPI001ABA57BD